MKVVRTPIIVNLFEGLKRWNFHGRLDERSRWEFGCSLKGRRILHVLEGIGPMLVGRSAGLREVAPDLCSRIFYDVFRN